VTGSKLVPPAPNSGGVGEDRTVRPLLIRLPQNWGLGGLLLCLALPVFAQTSAPALLPNPPRLVIANGSVSGPIARPHIDGFHAVYGGEVTFEADQADLDFKAQRYLLSGHVRLHEADTTIQAAEITFNGAAGTADATQALVNRKVFTIRSARLEGTPELLTATDGDFTTVPPNEKSDYHIHAQTITLNQANHRGVLRNATFYLFGARLVTVPRVTFRIGGGGSAAQRQGMFPSIGVSARYGTYLAFGSSLSVVHIPVQYRLLLPTRQKIEATLTSHQTLYVPRPPVVPPLPYSGPVTPLDRIRAAATAPTGLLPEGDPLLFHDFLPEPNPIRLFSTPSRGYLGLAEELSEHVAARGRLRDDLYVTRLPEVTLSGQIPLTKPPLSLASHDPKAFRAALRHLVFYADAQETVGNYREELTTDPYTIRARRVRSEVGFSAFPLLIAPNTVLQPRISVSTSGYSGRKKAYRYDQVDVAVNHYFSDLTAFGVQFLASTTSGISPFNFDVLDTSRELDLRLQVGNRHLVAAGRLRYDLSNSGVIDYQIAVAPSLRGFIPVFSYNFRTRSLGLGLEIKGVTF
jgi:hypothetical protein